MKTKLIFILTLFFCGFAPESEEKVAAIIDIRQTGLPEKNIVGHQEMDVDIYKMDSAFINPVKQYYLLVVYRMTDNQLKGNKEFINECDNIYDKVKYQWVNDSTLKYRLFNSANNLYEKFSYIIRSDGSSQSGREPADKLIIK